MVARPGAITGGDDRESARQLTIHALLLTRRRLVKEAGEFTGTLGSRAFMENSEKTFHGMGAYGSRRAAKSSLEYLCAFPPQSSMHLTTTETK